MLRRSLLGIGFGLGLALGAGPALADALADIKERGTLRVAVPQDFPPFGSVGPDLEPVGYDIDVANALAEAMDVTVELVPVTSANRIPYLQTGRVDLVISSLGRNAERELVIDFSDPYAPFYNGIFGESDLALADMAGLDGKVVAVTRGSVEDLALTEEAPDGATINRFEDNNGTISAFLSGQADVIATGNVVAAAILEQDPPREPALKFLVQDSPCYIGLAKGEDALLAEVNRLVAEMKADGRLDAISQEWLNEPLPADL